MLSLQLLAHGRGGYSVHQGAQHTITLQYACSACSYTDPALSGAFAESGTYEWILSQTITGVTVPLPRFLVFLTRATRAIQSA